MEIFADWVDGAWRKRRWENGRHVYDPIPELENSPNPKFNLRSTVRFKDHYNRNRTGLISAAYITYRKMSWGGEVVDISYMLKPNDGGDAHSLLIHEKAVLE